MDKKFKGRVVITGGSGFLGQALIYHLRDSGYFVQPLKRGKASPPDWNPELNILDPNLLEGYDTLIHLGGVSLTDSIWTPHFKKTLYHSRIHSTELLVKALKLLNNPPGLFIHASATGFYGHRGDEVLTESSPAGLGFLAGLCRDWEDCAQRIEVLGFRRVSLRFGVILGQNGGIIPKLKPLFNWGFGGNLGAGHQWMSWLSIRDTVRAIAHCIEKPTLSGPVNIVAPFAVTNQEFTQTMAQALKRPAFFHVPEFILKNLPGDMGNEMLLNSCRAKPQKLVDSGFEFREDHFPTTLTHLLIS